jgi:hypothetical protein
VCSYTRLIEEMALYLAGVLESRECPYEALDSSAMPVRDAKRRGAGWLAGYADIGWSNTLGWYEGFRCCVEGAENHQQWLERYGAQLICPPKRNARKGKWPKRLRQWVASIRQIVESVYDKLFNTFGLWREPPHELQGLRSRLAARVALHNFCIWLNEQLGRPRLAFADLQDLRGGS